MDYNNRYINLLIRLVALGVVVFVTVSYVPTTPLTFEIKLLISLLVVVTYSILDLLGVTVMAIKDSLCTVIC